MNAMSIDGWTLATIACMGLATFMCRAGGYVLFKRFRPSRTVHRALGYVPGALFVSYVVPGLAAGGPLQWVGGAATLGLMVWTGSLSWSILGGTGAAYAVWLMR